jgi:hypothetical protein
MDSSGEMIEITSSRGIERRRRHRQSSRQKIACEKRVKVRLDVDSRRFDGQQPQKYHHDAGDAAKVGSSVTQI